ncbi:phage distal tail protein [uncultured Granulicatella sp.]|uniref:phage distal tail protein n=1 Tax=uncultured Granulicatella sp. TaxID=316089 RepID=UPI0028DC7450|nr:phage tail domain-containing protein [uncultured Granulicatella sp.]
MIGFEMSINNVKNTELPVRVVVAEYERLFFSESNNSIQRRENGSSYFKKSYERKEQVKTFEIHIHTTKQTDLDHFNRWIMQENVEFEPDTSLSRVYTAFKFNVTSITKHENIYVVQLQVTFSFEGLSKIEKTATRGTNTGQIVYTFDNQGVLPTAPLFSFTSGENYKMISFIHPNGKYVQYGHETGEVVIKPNDVVVFDFKAKKLTINGTEKYVNMSSSWFDLNVGQTEIGILTEPNNNISIDAKFKEAWQ